MTGFIRHLSKDLLLHSRSRMTHLHHCAALSTDVTRTHLQRTSFSTRTNMADSDTHRSLIGKLAPSFKLPNYDGNLFSVDPGEKGIPTVIFVYPSSGSYGCTQQACQFRNAVAEKPIFAPEKVQIIGLSADSVEKQKAFVEKQQLTYPVLSDVNKEAIKVLKVGSGMMGLAAVARVTYVIDKKGIVRDTLDATMNYGAHSKFVENWLKKLEAEDAVAASKPTETTSAAPAQKL